MFQSVPQIFYVLNNLTEVTQPYLWAVVLAQLVERSLPIPGAYGLSPVIGKHTVNCIEKTKIEKKRPGKVHLKKNSALPISKMISQICTFVVNT